MWSFILMWPKYNWATFLSLRTLANRETLPDSNSKTWKRNSDLYRRCLVRGNYTACHKAESPKYALRTSFSLLKIVFFMTASTFLLTWPTASLPPPPITLLGLSAAPAPSCLLDLWPWASHGRTIWPPLVSKESLLSPKGEEEVIVNSDYLIFCCCFSHHIFIHA